MIKHWAQVWCQAQACASTPLSVPDLTLVGHTADAQYALGVATVQPLVASGGQDKNASPCSWQAVPCHLFLECAERSHRASPTCQHERKPLPTTGYAHDSS